MPNFKKSSGFKMRSPFRAFIQIGGTSTKNVDKSKTIDKSKEIDKSKTKIKSTGNKSIF